MGIYVPPNLVLSKEQEMVLQVTEDSEQAH